METKRIADHAERFNIPTALHACCSPIGFMANVHLGAAIASLVAVEHHGLDLPFFRELVTGLDADYMAGRLRRRARRARPRRRHQRGDDPPPAPRGRGLLRRHQRVEPHPRRPGMGAARRLTRPRSCRRAPPRPLPPGGAVSYWHETLSSRPGPRQQAGRIPRIQRREAPLPPEGGRKGGRPPSAGRAGASAPRGRRSRAAARRPSACASATRRGEPAP